MWTFGSIWCLVAEDPLRAADHRLTQAARRLREAEEALAAAQREHSEAADQVHQIISHRARRLRDARRQAD